MPQYENGSSIWPMRCSHRGGAMEQSENSLQAFEHSINSKIMFLECDVHMTKDNIVIVSHDGNLSRVCEFSEGEQRRHISEFNYDELPSYKKGFKTGLLGEFTWNHHQDGQNLCKLEDLFILCQSHQ